MISNRDWSNWVERKLRALQVQVEALESRRKHANERLGRLEVVQRLAAVKPSLKVGEVWRGFDYSGNAPKSMAVEITAVPADHVAYRLIEWDHQPADGPEAYKPVSDFIKEFSPK